jgi:TRAP-type mannitol/chloroaromatic compound transport system permease large subunit
VYASPLPHTWYMPRPSLFRTQWLRSVSYNSIKLTQIFPLLLPFLILLFATQHHTDWLLFQITG